MKPGTSPHVLLSLRPVYIDAMIDGSKSVEIRRNRLRAQPGSPALLYASSPRRALVATAMISDVTEGDPTRLWEEYGPRTALTKECFDEYLRGARNPTAISLESIRVLDRDVELDRLRQIVPGFHPPQTWHLLRPAIATSLIAG